MMSRISGESSAKTTSSAARNSSSVTAESLSFSLLRYCSFIVTSAATASSADERSSATSPGRAELAEAAAADVGRTLRNSISAAVATQEQQAGSEPDQGRRGASAEGTAGHDQAIPQPNSVTHIEIAAGLRSFSGNSAVGPSPAAIDFDCITRTNLTSTHQAQRGEQWYLHLAQQGQHVNGRSSASR